MVANLHNFGDFFHENWLNIAILRDITDDFYIFKAHYYTAIKILYICMLYNLFSGSIMLICINKMAAAKISKYSVFAISISWLRKLIGRLLFISTESPKDSVSEMVVTDI